MCPTRRRCGTALRSHLTRTDVVAPNLPGFDAPLPAGFGATKEEYVDWVIGEIEKVGEPVDLVGHDWGSIIVLRVTSVRPDLVRTLACGRRSDRPRIQVARHGGDVADA